MDFSTASLNRQRIRSTIRTVLMIHTKISITVPQVYFWATTEEKIFVPYSLESFVHRSLLTERWTDRTWTSEGKRLNVLRNLAATTSQLAPMTFNKISASSHALCTDSFQIEPLFLADCETGTKTTSGEGRRAAGQLTILQSYPLHAPAAQQTYASRAS